MYILGHGFAVTLGYSGNSPIRYGGGPGHVRKHNMAQNLEWELIGGSERIAKLNDEGAK